MSAPTTNTTPGKRLAFSANVGARVIHNGARRANWARRRQTSAAESAGLSTLTTLSSNAAGPPTSAAPTSASRQCPSCTGLNEPGKSTAGLGAFVLSAPSTAAHTAEISLRNKTSSRSAVDDTVLSRGDGPRFSLSEKVSGTLDSDPCGIRLHLSPTRQRGPCLRGGLRYCRFTHTDLVLRHG